MDKCKKCGSQETKLQCVQRTVKKKQAIITRMYCFCCGMKIKDIDPIFLDKNNQHILEVLKENLK